MNPMLDFGRLQLMPENTVPAPQTEFDGLVATSTV